MIRMKAMWMAFFLTVAAFGYGAEEIKRVGEPGVEPPIFYHKIAPDYPPRAVKARFQGYVILEAIMGKDGEFRDFQVLRGLGKGKFGFEEEAIKAVSQWKYKPGKLHGEPIDVRMTLKIDFVLDGKQNKINALSWWATEDQDQQVTPPTISAPKEWLEEVQNLPGLSIEVEVNLDPLGGMIGYDIDSDTLLRMENLGLNQGHVQNTLGRYKWKPSHIDGEPVPTTLRMIIKLDEDN